MGTRVTGRFMDISKPRRWVCDLLAAGADVPLIPFERQMPLAELVAARNVCNPRPSWCAVFTKAWAITALRMPVLRRAYMKFPWRRIYEHPISVASVMVERECLGETGIIPVLVREPDRMTLQDIDARIEAYRTDDLWKHGSNRRIIRSAKYPRFIRAMAWWYMLNWDGKIRTYNAGTFGVSVTAGHGATAKAILAPITSSIHYGIFDASGVLPCRISFDHRVIDGGDMARALVELEKVLRTEMLSEIVNANAQMRS